VLGTTGLLLRGPSGSGKSMLGHHLIASYQAQGQHAVWVADDRVNLDLHHGRIIATPVAELEGIAEFRGLGVRTVENTNDAAIDMIVDLTGIEERVPEMQTYALIEGGPTLPLLRVPPRNITVCELLIVEALRL